MSTRFVRIRKNFIINPEHLNWCQLVEGGIETGLHLHTAYSSSIVRDKTEINAALAVLSTLPSMLKIPHGLINIDNVTSVTYSKDRPYRPQPATGWIGGRREPETPDMLCATISFGGYATSYSDATTCKLFGEDAEVLRAEFAKLEFDATEDATGKPAAKKEKAVAQCG